MAKIKKLLTPRVTMGLFVLALILLLMSSVSGTRAALTYFSDDYTTQMATQYIGVALVENDDVVSQEAYGSAAETHSYDLLHKLPADASEEDMKNPEVEKIAVSKPYEEVLQVRNMGTIGQYVRVTVYRYWTDAEGVKQYDLNPDFIHLDFKDGVDGWVIDHEASTTERTVLYYTVPLTEQGSTSAPLATTLTLDPDINNVVTRTKDENGALINSYDYDGMQFHVEAVVDAIQEHNASDAAMSVWGVDRNY